MTTENEIRALTKVCRLLVLNERFNNTIPIGAYDQAISLLDTIDAVDDEPERKECTHKINVCYRGRIAEYEMFRCSRCKTLGRKLYLGPSTHGEIEWWPEGGAK